MFVHVYKFLVSSFLRNQNRILISDHFFICHERHDVFRVPRKATGFHVLDLISWHRAVNGFAAIEYRRSAILSKRSDHFSLGGKFRQREAHFFARAIHHDGRSEEECKTCENEYHTDSHFGHPRFFCKKHTGENGEGKERGEGIGGIFCGDQLEEEEHREAVNHKKLRAFACTSKVQRF